MTGMNFGMLFDTLGTKVFIACKICTKVGDGLFFMKGTRYVVFEVSFHIFNVEGFVHLFGHDCYLFELSIKFKFARSLLMYNGIKLYVIPSR